MKKYIIICALIFGSLGCVFAQGDAESFGPSKGDFTGAILFGRGSFLSTGLDVPSAPYNNWTVSGSSPYLNTVEAGYNDVSNMLGIEGRYFVTSRLAIKVSGGAIIRNTPAVTNLPGIMNSGSLNASWIPNYNSVVEDKRVDANFNLGVDLVFPSKKFERMFPYVGLNIPFLYGRRTLYDPTITIEPDGSFVIADISERHAEIAGFGLQAVAGVDYYIAKGLYTGFEFKPVSYIYSFNVKLPAAGLETLEAETHTLAFFSQIYFKLGFRF